jgi:hypothetical protein
VFTDTRIRNPDNELNNNPANELTNNPANEATNINQATNKFTYTNERSPYHLLVVKREVAGEECGGGGARFGTWAGEWIPCVLRFFASDSPRIGKEFCHELGYQAPVGHR